MSPVAFDWFLTLAVGVVAGIWVLYDIRNLVKLRGADRADAVVRDKQFGYVIGMIIGVIGVLGCLKFQGVL